MKTQKDVRSTKENLSRHREDLNRHDQTVKRNLDTQGPDGEGLEENEENDPGNWRKESLIIERQKARWSCVPQLCGKQNLSWIKMDIELRRFPSKMSKAWLGFVS